MGKAAMSKRATNAEPISEMWLLWQSSTVGVPLSKRIMGLSFQVQAQPPAYWMDLTPVGWGVIYDPANQVIEGYEPYRMGLGLLGPYLAHVHLKNTAWRIVGVREDGSTSWEPVFVPLNKGILNIKALFENLVAVGYDGWVSLEDFSTEEPTRKRLQNAMAYIKQIMR